MIGASQVAAQQLSLQIQDGKVTLDAVNVPARQILAEWARVGGTKVVGAEKIVGPPLTLKLVGTPERRALDIVLGNVAGFMAAERQASAAPGASAYDRILILASSTAPPAQASASRPGQGGQTVGTQRRVPPRPPNLPQPADDDNEAKESEEQEAANQMPQNPPVFSFPGAGGPAQNPPVFVPVNQGNAGIFGAAPQTGTGVGASQPGMVTPPVITMQPNPNGQPTIFNFVPNGQGVPQPVPTTPGFSPGSATPGVIQPPPPPPTRPPGQ
jgi:hypothetical protein